MKNKLIYVLMVFAFGIVVFVQAFYHNVNAKDRKLWEYKTVYASVQSEFNQVNEAGQDGWELVAVQPVNEIRGYYIFKRAKE